MTTTNPTRPISARNLAGDDLALRVVTRVDLICIQTNGDVIVMSPATAAELVMALLHELGARLVPPAGPLTGVL